MFRGRMAVRALALAGALAGLGGCQPALMPVSRPASAVEETASYSVRVRPLEGSTGRFTAFSLEVTNKGETPLLIDWNRTRYLHQGAEEGGFVFVGIRSEDIRRGTIPLEAVGPHETLVKEIAPQRALAWRPVRDSTGSEETLRGIGAGPLPEGENGIRLVMLRGGKEIRTTLTLVLTKEGRP